MIENRISGYLYSERFSKSNEEKSTGFQRMAWSLIVHKNPIKNCTTALQAFFFRSLSLYPLFHFSSRQGYSCSSSAKLSASCICSHKCFNYFQLSKNILINKFFHWNMCFFIFLPFMTQGSCRLLFDVKYSHAIKNETFPFFLTNYHTEIWEIISSAIKN